MFSCFGSSSLVPSSGARESSRFCFSYTEKTCKMNARTTTHACAHSVLVQVVLVTASRTWPVCVKSQSEAAPGRSGSYHAWRIYWAKRPNAESHLRVEHSVRNTDAPRRTQSADITHQQHTGSHTALLLSTRSTVKSTQWERSAPFHSFSLSHLTLCFYDTSITILGKFKQKGLCQVRNNEHI